MTSAPQGQERREVRLPLEIVSIVSLRMHAAHSACLHSLKITVRVVALAASAQRAQRTSAEVVMLLIMDGDGDIDAQVTDTVAVVVVDGVGCVLSAVVRGSLIC